MKIFIVLIAVISLASLTLAQNVKVYDKRYDLKYRIEGDNVRIPVMANSCSGGWRTLKP